MSEKIKELKKEIEAILYATQGMRVVDLVDKTESSEALVLEALNDLEDEYKKRDTGLLLFKEGDLWKIKVKQEHIPLVRDLIPKEYPKSLLETLAVIAFNQPILQSEVIKIRGNKAYDHVKSLCEKEFVKTRKKGRTNELLLGNKFFEYFNMGEEEVKKAIEAKKAETQKPS